MIDPTFHSDNFQLARKLFDASMLRHEAIATTVAKAERPGFHRLVGFEIFDKGQFGLSDFVQRTNYLCAVQGDLACLEDGNAVRFMDGEVAQDAIIQVVRRVEKEGQITLESDGAQSVVA